MVEVLGRAALFVRLAGDADFQALAVCWVPPVEGTGFPLLQTLFLQDTLALFVVPGVATAASFRALALAAALGRVPEMGLCASLYVLATF